MTKGKTPASNMRLASCGVQCLDSSAVFQINFSAGLTVLCPEIPHERQAQKRWQKILTSVVGKSLADRKTELSKEIEETVSFLTG